MRKAKKTFYKDLQRLVRRHKVTLVIGDNGIELFAGLQLNNVDKILLLYETPKSTGKTGASHEQA